MSVQSQEKNMRKLAELLSHDLSYIMVELYDEFFSTSSRRGSSAPPVNGSPFFKRRRAAPGRHVVVSSPDYRSPPK